MDQERFPRLLLRPAEVAEALGVGRSKAYQLIASGVIPSISLDKSRRVPAEALRKWVTEQLRKQQGNVDAAGAQDDAR